MMRAADLFAGIGGMRLGLERAFGSNVETVYVCEIDPFARKTYFANFDSAGVVVDSDITKVNVDAIPDFDICLAGFPCQAFSIAGKHGGFQDERGNLFMHVVRICRHIRPKAILCENVKGLVVHNRGRTFETIQNAFAKIGYKVHHAVLNSKDFGLAQNRERVYIICFRNDIDDAAFAPPSPARSPSRLPTFSRRRRSLQSII